MNEHQHSDQTDLDSLHAAVRREKPDVQPGQEPTPIWVFFATMLAMVLGGGYAGAYVGNFSFNQSNPFISQPTDVRDVPKEIGGGLSPFQLAMKKGETTFNNCAGCHMTTGLGQPGAIPPLAGSEWVMGGTERIARIAMFGLAGPVTVKGANFNNVMQPPPMSDQEIANVLTYVRNSWGNHAHMVTKEMVTWDLGTPAISKLSPKKTSPGRSPMARALPSRHPPPLAPPPQPELPLPRLLQPLLSKSFPSFRSVFFHYPHERHHHARGVARIIDGSRP